MKRIISLLVVMAMMLASVLAVIPVSATGSIDTSDSVVMNNDTPDNSEDEIETFRLLPKAAYDRLKAEFEADGANTPAYQPSVTPFAPTNDDLQGIIGGNRIHSITLPIKNVKDVDANGNINFTIKVFKYEGLVGVDREPVSTHVISVTPESVGLTAPSTNVHKFVEFELDEPIDVQEDEIIALMASSDEIIPAWADGGAADIQTVINEEFLPMRWFCANIGKAASSGNNFDAIIFYDLELEPLENAAPVGTAITDAAGLEAMKIGGSYYLANDITLPDTWAGKTLKNVTFDGNGKTITLAGANGLFGDVTNSTVKNLTLAGEVTPAWGVANNASGATFKSINVNLKGLNGTGNVGAIVATAKGSVTIDECINNAPINTATSGNTAAMIGKAEATGDITVTNSKNTATIYGNNAGAVIGQAETCTAGIKLNVVGFENSGELKGGTTAGTIIAYNCGAGIDHIYAKDVVNLGDASANWVGGFIGAQHRSSANVKFENCVNGKEGDATVAEVKAGSTGAAGFIMEGYTATYTINNCKNYANVNGASGQAGAIFGKINGSISVDTFYNSGNVTAGNTAAAIAGWYNSGSSFIAKNVTNLGTISANNWAAGMIGANFAAGTQLINCVNGAEGDASKGAIVGNCTKKGGFVSESNNDLFVSGGAVYGSISGSGCAGGIVAYFTGTKLTVRNVVSDFTINVSGAWNNQHGGFVGKYTSNNAEFYFTDCVNNTNLISTVNANPGGFIGGGTIGAGDERTAKKIAFLRCVNNGDLSSPGCAGGFIGQNKAANVIFIDCLNTGDITSTENVSGGFTTYSAGYTTITFINCVNTGEMTATKDTKWAAGFAASGATNTFVYDSANYGDVTGKGKACGFSANGTKLTIENSFNAGTLSANDKYSFSNCGNQTITGCIDVGNHKNLLDRIALLEPDTYATIVEQDKWDDLKAAFDAAKVVYDNAESTNTDKKAVIAVIEAVIDDMNTYVDAEAGATFADPSLKINVKVADDKSSDYVALVKDGDTDATIKVLAKDITKDFDLFTVTPEEGKDIVAGTYKLYLLRGNVEVADAVADATLALDVEEVIVDVNVIKTAEQFMAMANQTGDYILGNDIAVPGDIWFAGNFDGMGYTISLTGTTGLFKYLNGTTQTIKNFNLEAAYIDNSTFSYGVIYSLKSDVTVENVHVGAITITNGDRAAAVITTVDHRPFNNDTELIDETIIDITVKNVTSAADIYGNWLGAGIIGRAYVNSITLENVVNNGSIVSTTQNHDSGNFGSGGLLSDIQVLDKLTIKDAVNNANLKATRTKMGGIVALVGGTVDFDNVINNGNFDSTGGWAHGEGGMIAYVRSASTITFDDCVNYGSFTKDSNTNKGGFIGMTDANTTATFTNCVNYGSVSGETNNAAGGFVGQAQNSGNDFTFNNCTNYGSISATGANGAGGIIGQYTGTKLTLNNVNNLANVTGATFAGGIAGQVNAANIKLENVSNGNDETSITVTGNNLANSWETHGTAGIFGYAIGKLDLDYVYNYAKVANTGARATAVGGFIGMLANGGSPASEFIANDCANYGDIEAKAGGSQASGFIAHVKYVPGINLSFYDCDNYGDVTGTSVQAGGFIGRAEPNAAGQKYIFENANNYGDINITAGGNVGGFIGLVQNTEIIFGSEEGATAKNYGNVSGVGNAGGFVGQPNSGTVKYYNVENNGDITSTGNQAGGLSGWGAANAYVDTAVNNGKIIAVANNQRAAGFVTDAGTATLIECTNNGTIISNGVSAGLLATVRANTVVTGGVNNGIISSTTDGAYATYAGATPETAINNGTVLGNYDPTSKDTFIEVWTAEDFMNMSSDFSYILMDNIILPEDYESIAFGSDLYATVIDGNGKIIYMKGLTCPLFSTLDNANIKDLTIVGNISGDNAVAVIATKAIGDVTIDNVIVDVDINCTANATVGGFIAESAALTITDSKFLGSIDALGYAGGFAGIANGAVTVTNSVVGAAGLTTHINGTGRVGGLFGLIKSATATLSGAKNFASVNQTSDRGIAGGLIAQTQLTTITLDGVENYGEVYNNRGGLENVPGKDVTVEGTGGLIGEVNSNSYATILNSVNYADVTTRYSVAGGLVGTVTNSSNVTVGAIDGDGVVSNGSINYGDVCNTWTAWTYAVGGIIGATDKAGGDLATDTANIEIKVYDTVNYGNVSTKAANAGGVLGLTADRGGVGLIEVIGSENYGSISSEGDNRVGGILGQTLSTTIRIKDTTNYGAVSSQSAIKANGDTDAGTCHAAGIRPEHYAANTTTEFINCVNYGTIYSKTSSAAGITVRIDATNAKLEGCVNYGTIIGGFTTSGVCSQPKDGQVKDCANFGLILSDANGAQVAPGADYTNVAAGAVITDTDIAKVAKTINAADYKLADLIGTVNTAEGSVDPTALTFATYDEEGIAADFDFYFVLTVDGESILSDATVEGDYAGHTALEARSYAAKLARVSSDTNYTLTFNANTTGADAGFVYAITPAGTVKTYLTAIDAENMVLDGDYAQFKVEYTGLIATISVLANGDNGEEWVQIHEALLEDGAYAAIGIANGASATTGEGEEITTFADTKQVANVTEIAFSNTYLVGGIINAFRALDRIAIELSDAAFEAEALAAALAAAQEAEDLALAEVAAAQKAVEDATAALNAAVIEGQREGELADEMQTLEEAIARHDQAKRDEHLNKKDLDNVTANEAKIAQAYADLKASNKADVEEAVENLVATIDGAINRADFGAAILTIAKLGDKFATKYDDATKTAINDAIVAGIAATTQAELDAQVEIINDGLATLDWSAYNYWKSVMNSLEEEDYTILTWLELTQLKADLAAKEALLETQEQIDAMTGEIIKTIEALKEDVYLAAEMQEYFSNSIEERAYWNAEEENENYTANSWAYFYNEIIKPFEDAIDALANNEDVTQFNAFEATLAEKYEAFSAAYAKTDAENGIICMVELNALRDKALDVAEGTGDFEYSEITKQYLFAEIPVAERNYAKIAKADEIGDYAAAQKAADAALAVYAPVVNALTDVTELKATIAEYSEAVANTQYTAETWSVYEHAFAEAEFIVVTAQTDEAVAEALANLTAAYEALEELVAINLDALNNAIALAEALKKDDYTKSSWAVLRAAIVDAKNATYSDDQEVIDAAYRALVDVMDNGLVLVPDTATLEALIAETNELKADEYTKESWDVFALALQNAKVALNSESQKEVNDAKDALSAAKAELAKKAAADNSALKALIAEVEALKEADYTAATWAGIKTALDAAKAVLESDKQTDLDIAMATLAAAKAALVKVVVEQTEVEEDTKVEDTTTSQSTDTKKGCESAIGATVVVMTALLGLGATAVLKKKED